MNRTKRTLSIMLHLEMLRRPSQGLGAQFGRPAPSRQTVCPTQWEKVVL